MLAVSCSPVVLIHYYQNAIVATTLRYPDEVTDPSHFAETRDLPEANDEELALIEKIVDKMTTGSISECTFNSYKVRMETMIESTMKVVGHSKKLLNLLS